LAPHRAETIARLSRRLIAFAVPECNTDTKIRESERHAAPVVIRFCEECEAVPKQSEE